MPLTVEDRKKIIDDLITNEIWVEGDREALNDLPEDRLLRQQKVLNASMAGPEEEEEEDDPDEGDDPAPTGNARKQVKMKVVVQNCAADDEDKIVANWLKGLGLNASKEQAGSVLRNAIAFEAKQRETFTEQIVANSEFTEQWCAKQEIPVLEHLAAKLTKNEKPEASGDLKPSYVGAGGTFITNREKDFAAQDAEMGMLDYMA